MAPCIAFTPAATFSVQRRPISTFTPCRRPSTPSTSTSTLRHLTRAALTPPPKIVAQFLVDPTSGETPAAAAVTTFAMRSMDAAVMVTEAIIDLPEGDVRGVVTLEDGKVSTKRDATALLLTPTTSDPDALLLAAHEASSAPAAAKRADAGSWLCGRRVIVFGHGFSQRPSNYTTLLHTLAARGYTVLAPRTWLFDIVFACVQTVSPFDMPAKLQTAVLIDVARAAQLAADSGAAAVHVLGHSMGAGMALAYTRFARANLESSSSRSRGLGGLASCVVMAPAVRASADVPLNPYARIDGSTVEEESRLLKELAKEMAVDLPVLLLQGGDDLSLIHI